MSDRPILHVLDHVSPEISGYAVRSHSLLRHLREAGVPLLAVASSKPEGVAGEEVIDGVPYVRLPLRSPESAQTPLSLARRISGLAAWLRRESRARRVALVHAHSPVINGVAALWAARRTGIPIVYEMRSPWEDATISRGMGSEGSLRYRGTRQMETWLLRRVDAVAAISRALVAEIAARGISPARIFHTPNAIDCDLFHPAPPDAELMARHQLAGAIVVGYIGYFFAYEGIDDLVRAFARARRTLPRAKLLLVGDGEGDTALRALVRTLGVEPDVVFAGRVPHEAVQRYYSLCDALVYPRRSSRMTDLVTPLKPLEAMAMAKPIVVSDAGGLRELVRVGETGLMFPSASPEQLAEMLIAVGSDAALRARLGANARRIAAEQHDWARVVTVYKSIYRHLLGASIDDGQAMAAATGASEGNR